MFIISTNDGTRPQFINGQNVLTTDIHAARKFHTYGKAFEALYLLRRTYFSQLAYGSYLSDRATIQDLDEEYELGL